MIHLTLRVAWHEQQWDGTVCKHPSDNSFCLMLDRVRVERDDAAEKLVAGKAFHELPPEKMPACIAEAGAFMNSRQWVREFNHPYQDIPKAAETHGHLLPRQVTVPPYSTFAVPFWWMLTDNQKNIEQIFKEALPPDENAPFRTSWVFGLARQVAINQYFFDRIKPQKSLVFFYCKEGQPLGENINRLVIGVGIVDSVGPLTYFESNDPTKKPYPLWDRLIRHSIRPDGVNGFLMPYREYMQPAGDAKEDERRSKLLREIAVEVPGEYMREFSYMSEHADSDVALAVLLRIQDSLRKIKQHGIVKGPWDARERWVNAQIAQLWKDRGAFPGIGAALEAIGLPLGTTLVQELYEFGWLTPEEDPWPKLDELLRGFLQIKDIPIAPYRKQLDNVRKIYNMLDQRRHSLLKLLSRFSLTPQQMKRWFHPEKRPAGIIDQEILDNPYRICECDWGDKNDLPVAIGIIDRGLLPEASIAAKHPVPEPSAVHDPLDPRRVRGALVTILREASEQGDTFLSQLEILDRISKISLVQPCEITGDWLNGNMESLRGVVEGFPLPIAGRDEQDDEKEAMVLQLLDQKKQEDYLRKVLRARALKPVPSTGVDWRELIIEMLKQRGHPFDSTNKRHCEALDDQAAALEKVTTRRLSVLTGRAGTGKTSALGALFLCEPLRRGGILLLAPTGKARVRLGKAAGADAKTIAQFLCERDRFDTEALRPKFSGKEPYGVEKTVVVDECSMLTMDDLYALFLALDMGHVQRVILVGDPNQLPPIGTGRPFADLCAMLENAAQAEDIEERNLAGSLGRLSVEVRMKDNQQSDTLRLASWFTREPQQADADKVFSDLEAGEQLNDLDIQFWQDGDELRSLLLAMFQKHLGMKSASDIVKFNEAMGIENGQVDFHKVDGVENFQILSPVRLHHYGVFDLNRFIQGQFRKKELHEARRTGRLSLGDEEIVYLDKVIQLKNQYRKAYQWDKKEQESLYLANGEIGLLSRSDWNSKWISVSFAGHPGYTFSYGTWDFLGGGGPLELAYALTVHKSQGSEFETTFIILPQKCRLVTRELLYTAMTRSRQQLVLLVEGKRGDTSFLYEFTRPESSEVARRNTNLFRAVVRVKSDEPPYAEHLIHKTKKGHMVRSKSELIIANELFQLGMHYEYELPFELPDLGKRIWPDFRFTDPAGDTIIWEHLGMLHKDDYRESWNRKLKLYQNHGFTESVNLFTTRDDERGGLDSTTVSQVAEKIKALL